MTINFYLFYHKNLYNILISPNLTPKTVRCAQFYPIFQIETHGISTSIRKACTMIVQAFLHYFTKSLYQIL